MPCFSSITRTKMTDASRLQEALVALGWTIEARTHADFVAARQGDDVLTFSRGYATNGQVGAFNTGAGQFTVNVVQRKYTELGVRAWAKRAGYSVAGVENNGRKLTLVNRRA